MTENLVLVVLSSNEGAGEPARKRRLTRAFATRIHTCNGKKNGPKSKPIAPLDTPAWVFKGFFCAYAISN